MVVKFTVALLLAVSVLSVSLGVKEDAVHGTPIRHGKQDHYKDDGSHNVLFDLEALLGLLLCSFHQIRVGHMFLVQIPLVYASAGHFLVCTISCEPVVRFLPNFCGYIIVTY